MEAVNFQEQEEEIIGDCLGIRKIVSPYCLPNDDDDTQIEDEELENTK
jgi:hypothetical protein